MQNYAELHCISNFSFLRGASHPEELMRRAIELGYHSLAITDECSVAGVVRAWQARRDYLLEHPNQKSADITALIVGSEFHWEGHCFVLLAPNRTAYGELCQLITDCRSQAKKGSYSFVPKQMQALKHCLLLWRPELSKPIPEELINPIRGRFTNRLWLLAEQLLDEWDEQRYHTLLSWASKKKFAVTCANDVHFHHPDRQPLQDCLTAIRHGTAVHLIPERLFSNAERHLRSLTKLEHLYGKSLLETTVGIAKQCRFSLDELSYQYPKDLVPEGDCPTQWLRQLVEKGQQERFPEGTPESIQQTIEKELQLIALKEYEHYFLTLHDLVRFARKQGILCQGRGSAANSVVCYCLGITEVNPVEVNLLFERFISEARDEPPDIDVDFESQRREEVIQYVYQKYGRERAAITATVITYRPKSTVRDIGKALGLDLMQLEHVIANFGWRYRRENWLDDFVSPALGNSQRLTAFKLRISELLGFPRHLSQHVGGFVISEGALSELVPIENASMPGRTVIQWDKEDLESLGLMKVDILGLGMLTAIRHSLNLLSEQQGKAFGIKDIPRDDPATYLMLQKADSIGVFQVESRAQMNMLPRLKPANYYDLVIEISIVRPGPIHGDMVHPYLKRRNGEEAADYPLPELEPILKRTLGIPLFQEQVIAFAMVAADFTAAEADQLRRSMASWRKKGHMHRLQERLAANMAKKGFSETYIGRIQRQLEGFGEYGFPESHAASFALLVYVTSWLKCHHPALFCCSLLNSQPMGFYTPAQLLEDARHHGVQTLPIDINLSQWEHRLEHHQNQEAIRLGFRLVKSVTEADIEQLVNKRPKQGYKSIQECRYLASVDTQVLEALAAANVFHSLTPHRYDAYWQVQEKRCDDLFLADRASVQPDQNSQLSTERENAWLLPGPSEIEHLVQDYQTTGLSLGRHPIEILRSAGKLGNALTAVSLLSQLQGSEAYVAGLVTCRQRPGTSAGVTFVTLEDETGNINVVIWLSTAEAQLKELTQSQILQVYGKIEKDPNSGIVHLIAWKLLDLTSLLDNLNHSSHDYH